MTEPVPTVDAPVMVTAPQPHDPDAAGAPHTPLPWHQALPGDTPAAGGLQPPETAEQFLERRKAAYKLALEQSEERKKLAAGHAEKRKAPVAENVRAKLAIDQAEERRVMSEKHREARLKVDPNGTLVYPGLAQSEKVADLAADLAGPAADLDFMVGEPSGFGLDLEVYDPRTGLIVTAAHGARRGAGRAAVLMTADEVVAEITAARIHQTAAGTA
jgi:hypothetical protein